MLVVLVDDDHHGDDDDDDDAVGPLQVDLWWWFGRLDKNGSLRHRQPSESDRNLYRLHSC